MEDIDKLEAKLMAMVIMTMERKCTQAPQLMEPPTTVRTTDITHLRLHNHPHTEDLSIIL